MGLVLAGFFVAWALLIRATPAELSKPESKTIVARVWQGKVPKEKADEYEKYLNETSVKKLRDVKNNLGVQTFRRELTDATEFVVISYWPDREAIKAHVGDEIEKAPHLLNGMNYLIDPEPTVRHYDVTAEARDR